MRRILEIDELAHYPSIDTELLRSFVAIADTGGFTRAAEAVNRTQSAISMQMKRLEERLDRPIFARDGRASKLTEDGERLLDYARRMLALERQTASAVRQVGESVGELRIGSMETFAALHLPSALKAVRAQHPRLEVRVFTDTTSTLTEKVLDHKLDCAFVAGPVIHPDLRFEELVVEELVQVHAAGTDPVLLPLILFREGCAYRTRAIAWQRKQGHALADAMEFGTLEGILGCIAVGLGWTLMPRRVVEQSAHAADLVIESVPPDIALVPTGMIALREGPALPALRTLSEGIVASAQRPRAA